MNNSGQEEEYFTFLNDGVGVRHSHVVLSVVLVVVLKVLILLIKLSHLQLPRLAGFALLQLDHLTVHLLDLVLLLHHRWEVSAGAGGLDGVWLYLWYRLGWF